eukprot:3348456-Karenia_brevis.AAC.1
MLSWACLFGISEDFRAALGYHVGKQKQASVWVYARDRQAAPLNEVDKMLAEMRGGAFDPDEAESFTKDVQKIAPAVGASSSSQGSKQ